MSYIVLSPKKIRFKKKSQCLSTTINSLLVSHTQFIIKHFLIVQGEKDIDGLLESEFQPHPRVLGLYLNLYNSLPSSTILSTVQFYRISYILNLANCLLLVLFTYFSTLHFPIDKQLADLEAGLIFSLKEYFIGGTGCFGVFCCFTSGSTYCVNDPLRNKFGQWVKCCMLAPCVFKPPHPQCFMSLVLASIVDATFNLRLEGLV